MATATSEDRPKQNWILSPLPDFLLIIAAPILGVVWAVSVFLSWGETAVFGIFMVFNVGHHLPTWIRIYGDKNLLKRFRWSLILGPVVPFLAFMALGGYAIRMGGTVNNIEYMIIILLLWDPWHFLMQHYGFMRIYDRNNRAPRNIAARMDLTLCATWFVHILLSALNFIPDLIYNSYRFHGNPLLYALNSTTFQVIETLAFSAAIIATIVYAGYLQWCRRQGYYISWAKLALMLVTFSVMYLTYVPNAVMGAALPDWSFAMGFATLGMVHVTQYLAIVWKYNRRLAADPERVRSGWFLKSFASGSIAVMLIYVIACLLYGFLLGRSGQQIYLRYLPIPQAVQSWVLVTLAALNFTSTLLHYYYDGFIWKVRHKENRQALDMQQNQQRSAASEAGEKQASWWDTSNGERPAPILLRQSLYFLTPIIILAFTFSRCRLDPHNATPLGFLIVAESRLEQADSLYAEALALPAQEQEQRRLLAEIRTKDALAFAEKALQGLENQLDVEEQMIGIRPRAKHYIYIADLIEMRGYFQMVSQIASSSSRQPSTEGKQKYDAALRESIGYLNRAIALPPPYNHREPGALARWETSPTVREWLEESRAVGGATAPPPPLTTADVRARIRYLESLLSQPDA